MAKLHKNLFNNGDKIDASEIGMIVDGQAKTIDEMLGRVNSDLDAKATIVSRKGAGNSGSTSVPLSGYGLYLLVCGVGSSGEGSIGVYFINFASQSYNGIYEAKTIPSISVSISGSDLIINRSGNYHYSLLKLL